MSKQLSSKTKAESVADQFGDQCSGKTALVTGANSGLGFETCRVLALKGARIILACRNPKLGEEAVKKLKEAIPSSDVHFLSLDLGDLKSVKKSADEFNARFDKLDILVNNAGVMACPKTMTTDGLEMQFAVNHLGHFYFTKLLLPVLMKSGTKEGPSRVINLSSMAQMVFAPDEGIKLDDLNAEKSYNDWERYGQSKLANVLFSNHLNEICEDKNVISIALHPGVITSTNLTRYCRSLGSLFRMTGGMFKRKGGFKLAMRQRFKSIPEGAATTIVASLDPDVKAGGYYSDCKETCGADLHPKANDAELAKKLWDVSEKLCDDIVNKK
jgi:retinol dehydrogenase-12